MSGELGAAGAGRPASSGPSTHATGADTERAAKERRIALFGGSFDPVHVGHLHVARAARDAFDLERVLFVPAARPPHKLGTVLSAPAERVAMLRIALAGEPRFEVWEEELGRAGPSFTIDTVRALQARADLGPGLRVYLVMGGDSLSGLASWREVDELLSRAQPIVVWREAGELEALAGLRVRLAPSLWKRLERGLLRLPPVPVSASAIRAALARGDDPGDALPPGVGEYALTRGLYRNA